MSGNVTSKCVGILFSDLADYSKLTEAELATYATFVLDELAEVVINRVRAQLLEINRWGDAFLLVSEVPNELAHLALKIRDFFRDYRWANQSFKMEPRIRIALHAGNVSFGLDPFTQRDHTFGTVMTVPARVEPVTGENMVWTTEAFKVLAENKGAKEDVKIRFDDLGKVSLAKEAGRRRLFRLRRAGDSDDIGQIEPRIRTYPMSRDRRAARHVRQHERLDRCGKDELVRFIFPVGKRLMLPELKEKERLVDYPFPDAVARGVQFDGILLDPKCDEAAFRSRIQSPDKEIELLITNARAVQEELPLRYRGTPELADKVGALNLQYTEIGHAFSLWLFNDVAFVEPHHFGKDGDHLCGFSQLEIPRARLEYELLEKHFGILWKESESTPVWA